MEKKSVFGYTKVQEKEDDRQRRYGKVWDAVLTDYETGIFNSKSAFSSCYKVWLSKARFRKLKLL